MAKTHAVDRHAKVHENAFTVVVPGAALLKPWMPKSYESIGKSNEIAQKGMYPDVAMVEC